MKKLFVLLEQGCEPNYPLTKKHKRNFNTEYSDCFRLNWKADKRDTYADFFHDDLVFSEGRSYLYDQVKGNYEYYIFIDDDIAFRSHTNRSPAEEIKFLLEKYKPVHGSANTSSFPEIPSEFKAEVGPMMGGDECVQFFREDFADLMFPTWFHGAQKSFWYAQFIAYFSYPDKSIFLNSIYARNTRSVPHGDENRTDREQVAQYFMDLLRPEYVSQYRRWYFHAHNEIRNGFLDKNQVSTRNVELDETVLNRIFKEPCIKFEKQA